MGQSRKTQQIAYGLTKRFRKATEAAPAVGICRWMRFLKSFGPGVFSASARDRFSIIATME